MLVCIDLSKLYFSLRSLGVTINYGALLDFLRDQADEGEEVRFEAFTTKDAKNSGQQRFLAALDDLGVNLHTYNYTAVSNANFSTEMVAEASLSEEKTVIMVSNDGALMRVFGLLKDRGKDPALCFFSERLESSWTPQILRGDVKFIDLSDPDVQQIIAN